ncbi:hypothetical protein LOK49_LG01G02751 [Camellia lanceoleosa]|uniref:Uncharacterized protein n=1 Tax=Camellia lanceoleosa TaxID=1840588 RepID=A0ACC0IYS8_9ERIC|nr:hypothetical protein LOK49_LG01G02751 [Camellia lanceoleosa]
MADVNASSIRKLYASISEKTKMAANWRYTYIHDDHKDPLEAIDTHHVVVRRSSSRTGLVYLSSALLLPTTVFFFFSLSLLKDDSIDILLWSLLLNAFIAKLFLWNPVEKESSLCQLLESNLKLNTDGTTPTSENANTGLEVFVCHHQQQPRDCQPI